MMDYQEAIKILKKNKPTSDPRRCGKELCTACDIVISGLRKLEKYEQIGTLEELEEIIQNKFNGVELVLIYCSLEQLKKYKNTGMSPKDMQNLKECLDSFSEKYAEGTAPGIDRVIESLEKQVPKEPTRDLVYHHPTRWCARCGRKVLSGWKYCPECGQLLDWGEDE